MRNSVEDAATLLDNDHLDMIRENNCPELKQVFPSITGHAKIIDEYLTNPNAEFHQNLKTSREIINDAKHFI